ncbi:MAG TPA: glycogen debranching enzyme N-terminal domain-containing protein, partial [Candidatus Limnocylindrales bacterium]|nr:glycogen debranching enzyme N-terminal domain-containing protein [Candidatus Limnocylindrales bacterium]
MLLDYGREICGDLVTAESREWLCTNGMGGFASGTVAGVLTRRYHGLLVAALAPPVGRTLLVAKLEETAEYDGIRHALGANRWADGTIGPRGYHAIERFRLEGTTPVWTYALADALVDKRVWMEQGANTTYVRYRVRRARGPVRLEARALVNYRDYHTTTRGEGAGMKVSRVAAGIRVLAYDGARPFVVQASGSVCELAHVWYRRFDLARERERGLDAVDDHLHAGTFTITLSPGEAVTVVLSAEAVPALDGEAAWWRRREHEADLRAAWRRAHPASAPAWIDQLVLAADQFLVTRGAGLSIIAGYPWFADWGRDTMIALPGLLLVTGRSEAAARILTTFARFVDGGMLPNRFPDAGEPPEYNTVDATLWYVEAVRAYHAVTRDRPLLGDLFPVLEDIYRRHREGTRHGIGQDPADGLLRAGEPSVPLT